MTLGGIAAVKISLGIDPHLRATAETSSITSAVSSGTGDVTFSINLRFPTLELLILSITKPSTFRPAKSTSTFTPTETSASRLCGTK